MEVKDAQLQSELAAPNADYSAIAKKLFKPSNDELRSNNNTFIVLGTIIVWTCYMFFTGGRTYGQSNRRDNASSKIIQNMFISSAFAGLCSFALKTLVFRAYKKRSSKYDCLTLCNGILIGMVAISGVVDHTENWGAVLIGSIASVFYVGGILFLEFYRIDDPLEVFPVHCCGGIWGLFATGFFDKYQGALFYYALKQGRFMGFQFVGIFCIAAWTSLMSVPAFLIMRKLHLLRADKAVEEIGFDVAELGTVSEEFIDNVRQHIEMKDQLAEKTSCCCIEAKSCCCVEKCCNKIDEEEKKELIAKEGDECGC